MRKKIITIFLLILFVLLLLVSCAPAETKPIQPSGTEELVYTDFEGEKLAVLTGGLTVFTAESIGATPVYLDDSSTAAEDVRKGNVAGYLTTLTGARVMATQLEGFQVVPIPSELFSGQVAAISNDQNVINRFNAFLANLKADGTLDEMKERWFGESLDLDAPIPTIENNGENGVLRVATNSDSVPYVFIGNNGEFSGFSSELILRFGANEGLTIEFVDMAFSGLIPYIVSEKADIAISSMGITEERKKSVTFTDPYFDEQHGILTLKQNEAAVKTTFSEWLKTGIERNLITDNRWKMVVSGLGVTMFIALFAQLFGTILGGFVCFVLCRKNKVARFFGNLFCSLINGTPVVVLLMVTYYIIFGNSTISNVLVAVAAFSLVTSAVVAKNLKGAMDTVDPVEIEAARSIGFTSFGAFMTVTLPQAIRRALPNYTAGFVELLKATAIVGYIAIQDLTRAVDIIRSRTYDAFFPLLLVTAIYLVITTALILIFKSLVKKIDGGVNL